jgi:hypothetical protein
MEPSGLALEMWRGRRRSIGRRREPVDGSVQRERASERKALGAVHGGRAFWGQARPLPRGQQGTTQRLAGIFVACISAYKAWHKSIRGRVDADSNLVASVALGASSCQPLLAAQGVRVTDDRMTAGRREAELVAERVDRVESFPSPRRTARAAWRSSPVCLWAGN